MRLFLHPYGQKREPRQDRTRIVDDLGVKELQHTKIKKMTSLQEKTRLLNFFEIDLDNSSDNAGRSDIT